MDSTDSESPKRSISVGASLSVPTLWKAFPPAIVQPFTLTPTQRGGLTARKGYTFQDWWIADKLVGSFEHLSLDPPIGVRYHVGFLLGLGLLATNSLFATSFRMSRSLSPSLAEVQVERLMTHPDQIILVQRATGFASPS